MVVDPQAHLYDEWSPYCYVGDNPIKRIDPDGQIWGNVIGAVVGAAVEYGTQVAVNYAKGQTGADALWNNVDMADVGLATVEGAITSGGSVLRRVAISAGTEVVKAAIDMNGSGETDIVGTERSTKTATSVVTDAAIGTATSVGSSKVGDALVAGSSKNAVKSAQSNVTAKAKNLTKSNNAVKSGDLRAKTTPGGQAFNEFSSAKQSLDVTKALNSTVGQVNGDVVKSTVEVTGGVAGQGVKDIKDDILK